MPLNLLTHTHIVQAPMLPPANDQHSIITAAREFLTTFKSMQLATVNSSGQPMASYAPFVRLDNGQLGIFISDLAAHTANLRNQPVASALFIESETQAKQIFARKRLMLECGVSMHQRESAESSRVLKAMQQRFGDIIAQLTPLADFHVFTLSITQATYVTGFAQASVFSGSTFNANTSA